MGWNQHLRPTVQGKFDQEENDLGTELTAIGAIGNLGGTLDQIFGSYKRPGSIDVCQGTSGEIANHLKNGDYGPVNQHLGKALIEHAIVNDLSQNPAAVAVIAKRFGQHLNPPDPHGLDIHNKKACEDFLATNLPQELEAMNDKDFMQWAKDPVRMVQEISVVENIGSNPAKVLALAMKMNEQPPQTNDPTVLKKWVWDHIKDPLGDMDKSRLNEWTTFANNPLYLVPPSF